ncbi:MAG TPA: hypothetical protein VHW02_07745 [Rhizomicrobium sp.]|jgi:hypothetical protein|nr:hypothetical protein [Rhizomicrobium sp.]
MNAPRRATVEHDAHANTVRLHDGATAVTLMGTACEHFIARYNNALASYRGDCAVIQTLIVNRIREEFRVQASA